MICNYGNMSHNVWVPLKRMCSKEFGGKLIDVTYTIADWQLIFVLVAIPLLFSAALILQKCVKDEQSEVEK